MLAHAIEAAEKISGEQACGRYAVAACDGGNLAQAGKQVAVLEQILYLRALVILVAGGDLVRALPVQHDGGTLLSAKLEHLVLGEGGHRERRFFERPEDPVRVVGDPFGVEADLVIF